jgi:5-methylcytosine-specific restriction endonuclease McrA
MVAPSHDHIRPRRKGGRLTAGNKVLVCHPCNTNKGGRSPEAWLYKLERDGDRRAAIVAAIIGG